MILLFRYFWFLCAAVMLVNVAVWRRRLRKRVDDGAMTGHEMNGFIRGAALWLAPRAGGDHRAGAGLWNPARHHVAPDGHSEIA
jgi:hypothetical protein